MKEKNISSLLGRDREGKKGEPVGLISRFFAFVLDFFVITAIFFIVEILFLLTLNYLHVSAPSLTYQQMMLQSYQGKKAAMEIILINNILMLTIILVYFTVFDSSWGSGSSPGKRTLQIKVVGEDSEEISPGSAFLRNVVRLPWFLPLWLIPTGGFIFLIIDLALIWIKKKRIGDLLAKTHVEIY